MVLATPAIFKHGWLPGWIDEKTLETTAGSIPSLAHSDSSLSAFAVNAGKRFRAGRFNRSTRTASLILPADVARSLIRRLVPAGSVYFFRKIKGEASELAKLWLKPVSDDEQECRDGFGLAVWGTW